MALIQSVPCSIPDLEGVSVDFDMMASEETVDTWAKSGGKVNSDAVIAKVNGWPKEEYGPDPFGPQAPMAFRLWCIRKGYAAAVQEYVSDPN